MIINPTVDLPTLPLTPHPNPASGAKGAGGIEGGPSFRKTLKNALAKVNELQLNSDNAIEKFATGESDNLHELMIAIEEAKIALQFTIEVRNRIIEAYQELIRMQV